MIGSEYALKRYVFDILRKAAEFSGPLSTLGVGGGPLQVKYDNRVGGTLGIEMQDRCVYGGGVQREIDPEESVVDGNQVAYHTIMSSAWFIRIAGTTDTEIVDLDRVVEEVDAALRSVLSRDPFVQVVSADGEYSYDDIKNVALLGFEVQAEALIA